MVRIKRLYEYLDAKVFYNIRFDRIMHNFTERFTKIYKHYYGDIDVDTYVYSFSDPSDHGYEVYFTYNNIIKSISISFTCVENLKFDYIFAATNKFDQINILNTVIKSMDSFLEHFEHKVDYVIIAGSNPKKMRIYDFILSKFVDKNNWSKVPLTEIDGGEKQHQIIICKKNKGVDKNVSVKNGKLYIAP